MFLERFFMVMMPAFPIANRVVVLVILDCLDFLVLVVDGPLAVFQPFVVVANHRHIAKTRPALEFAVREAVFVRNFKFLDAIVVPFVALEDGSVRVNPDGGLFDSVCVPREDLFFSPLDGTAGGIA